MGTVRNRKREALSEEDVKTRFGPHGIGIEECDDGLCLIYGFRAGFREACLKFDHGATNDERWWADLRGLFKGKFWFKGESLMDRETLENEVNQKLFGLEPIFTIFC